MVLPPTAGPSNSEPWADAHPSSPPQPPSDQSEAPFFLYHGKCSRCRHFHIGMRVNLPTSSADHLRVRCERCGWQILGIGGSSIQISLASIETLDDPDDWQHDILEEPPDDDQPDPCSTTAEGQEHTADSHRPSALGTRTQSLSSSSQVFTSQVPHTGATTPLDPRPWRRRRRTSPQNSGNVPANTEPHAVQTSPTLGANPVTLSPSKHGKGESRFFKDLAHRFRQRLTRRRRDIPPPEPERTFETKGIQVPTPRVASPARHPNQPTEDVSEDLRKNQERERLANYRHELTRKRRLEKRRRCYCDDKCHCITGDRRRGDSPVDLGDLQTRSRLSSRSTRRDDVISSQRSASNGRAPSNGLTVRFAGVGDGIESVSRPPSSSSSNPLRGLHNPHRHPSRISTNLSGTTAVESSSSGVHPENPNRRTRSTPALTLHDQAQFASLARPELQQQIRDLAEGRRPSMQEPAERLLPQNNFHDLRQFPRFAGNVGPPPGLAAPSSLPPRPSTITLSQPSAVEPAEEDQRPNETADGDDPTN